MAIARNVSVPFDAPYHNFGVYNTEYRTVIDLSKFDLKKGAPVMVLDPHDLALSGDVSGKFRKAKKVPF